MTKKVLSNFYLGLAAFVFIFIYFGNRFFLKSENEKISKYSEWQPGPYNTFLNYSGVELLSINSTITHGPVDTRQYPMWVHSFVRQLFNKTPIAEADMEWYLQKIQALKPLGSWPPYNYEPLRAILKPAYQETEDYNLKVPLIVHFTWFYKNNSTGNHEMKFLDMISILAAYKKIKPYRILLWYDVLPVGEWWDYTVKHVPNLLMVYRETPTTIFNTTISFPEHKSDITRLEAVLTLGGIYLDLDSISLNSFHSLRNFSATQGAPFWYSLANGVMVAAPSNKFHWIFYLSYLNYKPKEFGVSSVVTGMSLARKYPRYINVDYKDILRPTIPERFYFYKEKWLWDWSKHYCVHVYVRFSTPQYNYESVCRKNNVIGEIYRHILYDKPVPNISERPSLFEMSSYHYKTCTDKHYPQGTWNCTYLAERFLKLNETYHFPIKMR